MKCACYPGSAANMMRVCARVCARWRLARLCRGVAGKALLCWHKGCMVHVGVLTGAYGSVSLGSLLHIHLQKRAFLAPVHSLKAFRMHPPSVTHCRPPLHARVLLKQSYVQGCIWHPLAVAGPSTIQAHLSHDMFFHAEHGIKLWYAQ